jgi:aminoglycoside 2''-phosphotransferase
MKAQMESRRLISSIEACFPEIRVTDYRRIRMGWETAVLEINGKYIFRFLNLQRRWPHQQAEITLLKWIAPKLKVDVPCYEFVWLGSRTHPQKFAGYRKILGSPLMRGVFRNTQIDRLGEDFGRFVTELHSIRPPGEALVSGYSRKSSLDGQLKFYQLVRKLVYPLLDVEARRRAEVFWTKFIEHLSNVDFMPRLIHSDLSGGNLIIDTSTGRLSGVIDWGNAKVGDPARDFMGVFAVSPRLGEQALANYDLDKSGFRERIGLYLLVEPSEDIGTGVQESEERFKKRFVGEGLRDIRKRLI